MPSEAPFASPTDPAKGLPTVVPPSGKFIVQLFLVPFLIVTTVVGFLLGVNWLVSGSQSPDDFLKRLDSPNADIRWRGAQDLAQILKRDDHLAANPKFALDLADRLRQSLRTATADEKAMAERSRQQSRTEQARERKTLEGGQDQVQYLSACLGNVMVPVGAPLLEDMALGQGGSDPQTTARRRWRAVWCLASLGQNLTRFQQLAPEQREAILGALQDEGAGSGERAQWARAAHDYLVGDQVGSLRALGIEKVLLTCATDEEAFMREITAFAMNFWEGQPNENRRLEEVLARLAHDDGHGTTLLPQLDEREELPDEAVTSVPGLQIRYNATIALARRGSDKVRLGVLNEMLDEGQQRKNFRLKQKNGKESADEAAVRTTLDAALQAVVALHEKRPDRDLSKFYPALDTLAGQGNIAVRAEAERTRLALGRK
jgi:hypothetical protein